ncbi:MAG: HPP family protein [Alphaproteobacteria bacterium]
MTVSKAMLGVSLKQLVHRHQAPAAFSSSLKTGFGAMTAVAFLGWLTTVTSLPLLIAPFGATSVLLFAIPKTPVAQPLNVVGGYLLAAGISLSLAAVLPVQWWSMGIGVGAVAFFMVWLGVVHPPAGGVPILVFLSHPPPTFLLIPILAGSVGLVAIAMVVHRLPPRVSYPLKPETAAVIPTR